MNQIDAILKHFKEWHPFMGIEYLWHSCDGEMDSEDYPDVKFEYDPDTAFFMALERLLKSGEACLFYVSCTEHPKKSELLTESPDSQITLLKNAWIGKEEMDKLDKEHDYLGWYFLVHCPYSLIQKQYDEHGNFLRWYVN
ncbi:hypothetical protein NDN11_17405 [Acinetobacter sp. C26M]|uniref:hypothetical protein n=1 Tax=unclassified Acinetobacter TaxID=196816 RepID=UPI002036CD1C|nr:MULTISPECIES: hypothetical protein [unclassified Acinetobacter]USA46435.1 hypothetical protein NDN11_17405 [Acinetobacter sp. C26M]USA49919.1 hypothetical protein NDN12_17320 [Acinetobacter sp. C26G]